MTSKNTLALFSIFLLFGRLYSCFARVNPYTRKDNGNRTIIWRVMLLFVAAGMLSACGGGGGAIAIVTSLGEDSTCVQRRIIILYRFFR